MWWKNIGILILDRLGLEVKKKPNCSVARCRAKAPHLNDPVVAGLVHNFSDLAKGRTLDMRVHRRAWEVDG
jgi:hypothetical protein